VLSRLGASEVVGRAPASTIVNLEAAHAEPRLALRVDGTAALRLSFLRHNVDLGSVTVAPGEQTVEVPQLARDEGFDQLRLVVERGDGRAAFGGLRFLPDGAR
jgi:hypothetical protein